MSHACHRFCKCYKTLTFCSLLAGCRESLALATRNDLWTWFEHVVLLTFWLGNVLRVTTARTFSTSQLFQKFKNCPKLVFRTFWLGHVLRATMACNFSSIISPDGSAPVALASLLFDPPEPQISGKKHSISRLCYLFAHLHLLSSDSFSSLIFSLLPFSSLTLPTSALPSVHIVGSLTSKLPSINCNCWIFPLPHALVSFQVAVSAASERASPGWSA